MAALSIVLLCAACASKSSPTTVTEGTPRPTGATVSDAESKKPHVKVPDGDPPEELVIKDLHKGHGDEATAASTVSVYYVGVSWSTHDEFDSSWGGEPVTFPLSRVVEGWQKGIPGMKVGGRRQLIIPPDLAYGHEGSPPVIGPDETLVFVIELLKVA
jgi:peptidylprolyl isomerase